jgi:hypothetical protein
MGSRKERRERAREWEGEEKKGWKGKEEEVIESDG